MVTAEDREFTQVTELLGSQVLNRALLLCTACKGSGASICLFLMGFLTGIFFIFSLFHHCEEALNTVHCMDLHSLAHSLKHTKYIQFLFFMLIVSKNQQHLQCRAETLGTAFWNSLCLGVNILNEVTL